MSNDELLKKYEEIKKEFEASNLASYSWAKQAIRLSKMVVERDAEIRLLKTKKSKVKIEVGDRVKAVHGSNYCFGNVHTVDSYDYVGTVYGINVDRGKGFEKGYHWFNQCQVKRVIKDKK